MENINTHWIEFIDSADLDPTLDYKTLSDSAVAKTTDARIVIVLRLQFAKVNMKRRVIDLKGI